MARTWTRWTRAQAQDVVNDLEASGQSVAEFARQRGLNPERVRRWQRQLQNEVPGTGIHFVELVARAPEDQVGLRILCPSGHMVEVGEVDIDRGLRAVLAALAEVSGC